MKWKRALIIGASGGIGRALCADLEAGGVDVTGLSRRGDGLDLTDPVSVERHLGALQGPFDLVVVASGALEIAGAVPEKSLAQIEAEAMAAQFALNAIGPALVLRHIPHLCSRRASATVAVLTARVGSIGDNRLGGWYSYRAAKAGANQIVRTASIELARTHKELTCLAIHPGTVATKFTEKYLARHPAVEAEEAARNILSVLEQTGSDRTGGFYDWAGKEVAW